MPERRTRVVRHLIQCGTKRHAQFIRTPSKGPIGGIHQIFQSVRFHRHIVVCISSPSQIKRAAASIDEKVHRDVHPGVAQQRLSTPATAARVEPRTKFIANHLAVLAIHSLDIRPSIARIAALPNEIGVAAPLLAESPRIATMPHIVPLINFKDAVQR